MLVTLEISLPENYPIHCLPILVDDVAAPELFLMAVELRSQLHSRGIFKETLKITEKQFKLLLNNLKESQRGIPFLNQHDITAMLL